MQLEIVEPALDEAAAAIEHYRAINPTLGADFKAELSRALALITAQPRAWARTGSKRHEIRRRVMKRFPYSVIYDVDHERVRVLAVVHQRQRPGYWRSRV
jgi:toxin ParE1/3/4